MADPRNPQHDQMADASMVRNLAFQAQAIWPQEERIFRRDPPPPGGRILDVGCGTGEISSRLAAAFPTATVIGVDVIQDHLARARERHGGLAPRLTFQVGDAFALPFPAARFDLAVCRHVLQAVPEPERVVAEMRRVTRPGGRVHLLLEDYGLLHASPASEALDRFWQEVPWSFGRSIGTDMWIGRRGFALLRDAGLEEIAHEDVVVDTLRVPREVLAGILTAWRDGYTEVLAQHSGRSPAAVRALWEELLAVVRDPGGYVVWRVPVWTARVPAGPDR